jgi:hypothetical protein
LKEAAVSHQRSAIARAESEGNGKGWCGGEVNLKSKMLRPVAQQKSTPQQTISFGINKYRGVAEFDSFLLLSLRSAELTP